MEREEETEERKEGKGREEEGGIRKRKTGGR